MSKKLCIPCWQLEKASLKSLISTLPEVVAKDAPLGYHFILSEWFQSEEKGKRYADYVFNSMAVPVN